MTGFVYNNKVQTSTKVLLFKAKWIRSVYRFQDKKNEKFKRAKEFVTRIKELHEEVETASKKSQEEMRKYVDRKRSELKKYRVGD